MKKLNKKGFTLIELLAVIAVLAIILMMAVPSVLSIQNNAKKGVAKDQAILIIKSVDLCIANNADKTTKEAQEACDTVEELKTNKYYEGAAGKTELAKITFAADGTVSINYIQSSSSTSAKNDFCAYGNKGTMVGGMLNADAVAAADVSSTNCK